MHADGRRARGCVVFLDETEVFVRRADDSGRAGPGAPRRASGTRALPPIGGQIASIGTPDRFFGGITLDPLDPKKRMISECYGSNSPNFAKICQS